MNLADSIREIKADFKFKWLEQIMKDYIKEALQEFLKEIEKRDDEKNPLLTIADIARRFKISKATVHNWLNKGILRGKKIGKNRYFTEEELREALTKYKFDKYLEVG